MTSRCLTKAHSHVIAHTVLLLLLSGAGARLYSQPAAGVPAPAIQAAPSPALTTGATALSFSPSMVPSPALNGNTNLSLATLSAQLTRFQQDLTQLLPLLAAFNNSFEFVTTGTMAPTPVPSGGSVNLGSNLGQNLGSNFSGNLGSSLGVVPNGSGTMTGASTNAFGFPAGLGVAPVTGTTLRTLLVLQSDLERIAPALDALNGSSTNFVGLGLTPGFVPGAVTNVFGISSSPQ